MSETGTTHSELLNRLNTSPNRQVTIRISALLEMFGHQATYRVRASSLQSALDALTAWGIGHRFRGGPNARTSSDQVTLSLAGQATVAAAPPVASRWVEPSGAIPTPSIRAPENPLSLLFDVDDAREAVSRAGVDDLLAALWACHPVCLLIDADDEMFRLAGGIVAAVLRRRALIVHRGMFDLAVLAPDILHVEDLRRLLGPSDPVHGRMVLPESGRVYLVRDLDEELEEDDLTATLRELFVPHSYRLRARFRGQSSPVIAPRPRLSEATECEVLLDWMGSFAGSSGLKPGLGDQPELFDFAGAFADAARMHDAVRERLTLTETDSRFRAGFESTEHMVLKKAVLHHLAARHLAEQIHVEGVVEEETEDDAAEFGSRRAKAPALRARPDIRVPGRCWVEVETLRGICTAGSNPFFALEAKLRRKLELLAEGEELWLLVPSDVALLATSQVCAVARNLADPTRTVRVGFLDLQGQFPVFMEPTAATTAAQVKVSGASWRTMGRREQDESVHWSDVAGYEGLRARVQADVLDPIKSPEKYSRYDIAPPNSLLLYGLPGCGKSLVGRVLAGEADVMCRRIAPSDITSMWLGEGVAKIRALFDWAIKQRSCLIVLDEIDAVAPVRREQDMHADQKRQVNELLTQLDRIARHHVSVVGTTNYLAGIDPAIRRSGRFDVKIPVFPPTTADRHKIFGHYLRLKKRSSIEGTASVDLDALARASPLYVPSDIENVVNTTLRRAVLSAGDHGVPTVSTDLLLSTIAATPRSISQSNIARWIAEVREENGTSEELEGLTREAQTVFGASP